MNERITLDETRFRDSAYARDHYRNHVAVDWDEYLFGSDRTVDEYGEDKDELFEPMTYEEYDDSADWLSKQPVRTSDEHSSDDIIGYVAKNGRIIKYKRSTNEMVVYKCDADEQFTLTYFKIGPRSSGYGKKKRRDYARDITADDDYYNR